MLPVNKKRGEEGGLSYHLEENRHWVLGGTVPWRSTKCVWMSIL